MHGCEFMRFAGARKTDSGGVGAAYYARQGGAVHALCHQGKDRHARSDIAHASKPVGCHGDQAERLWARHSSQRRCRSRGGQAPWSRRAANPCPHAPQVASRAAGGRRQSRARGCPELGGRRAGAGCAGCGACSLRVPARLAGGESREAGGAWATRPQQIRAPGARRSNRNAMQASHLVYIGSTK